MRRYHVSEQKIRVESEKTSRVWHYRELLLLLHHTVYQRRLAAVGEGRQYLSPGLYLNSRRAVSRKFGAYCIFLTRAMHIGRSRFPLRLFGRRSRSISSIPSQLECDFEPRNTRFLNISHVVYEKLWSILVISCTKHLPSVSLNVIVFKNTNGKSDPSEAL